MSGEEDWEEEERGTAPEASGEEAWSAPSLAPRAGGLSLGFLAMLPLFVAYDLGLRYGGGARRSTAELLLFRVLEPLGDHAEAARWGAIVLASVAAGVVCFRRRLALIPGVVRIVGEGAVAAMLLGPALAGLFLLLGEAPPAAGAADPTAPPSLDSGAIVFGGAAYEELCFRVFVYGLIFLLGRRVARFLGLARAPARITAEIVGCVGSATVFAAFHLAAFTSWLGPGGERFDAGVFMWRFLAGILLAVLFRWRGPGVAAWAHGLFNLALLLGAGTEAST